MIRLVAKALDFAGMRDWHGHSRPPTVANARLKASKRT